MLPGAPAPRPQEGTGDRRELRRGEYSAERLMTAPCAPLPGDGRRLVILLAGF